MFKDAGDNPFAKSAASPKSNNVLADVDDVDDDDDDVIEEPVKKAVKKSTSNKKPDTNLSGMVDELFDDDHA